MGNVNQQAMGLSNTGMRAAIRGRHRHGTAANETGLEATTHGSSDSGAVQWHRLEGQCHWCGRPASARGRWITGEYRAASLEGDWQLNDRAVPVMAIKQPRPSSSLNHHARNATQRYPGEISPHPPQSPSLPAGVSVAIRWAISAISDATQV